VTDAEAFPGFFTAVTGHEPFEWQDTLTRLLLEGGLPAVIDVPTGFGKTSVVLSWAFALAHADPEVRPPRRLLMVVDRRLVVDASYDLALRLRSALTERATALVAGVADGLQALTDPAAAPLAVARIRGGMTWESVWLPRADQAAVVAATVDQVGSRLLFRGYGASARMRPVDAALVGTDAWLVLDEAHIAEPLLRTARSVAAYQALPPEAVVRPLRVTAMTATPPDAVANSFKADPAVQRGSRRFVQSAAAAAARLDARKPVRLVEVTDLVTPSRKLRQQIEQLGQVLGDLALGIDAPLVGVMANTVVAARAAHARVTAAGVEAVLLIGRCREHERDVLWREYATRLLVGRARDEERLVVVATQTLEVGADVDLEALVTECAPLSSLLQRFGRVDRVGNGTGRVSAVVHAPALHAEDPVYGSATAATWQPPVRQHRRRAPGDAGLRGDHRADRPDRGPGARVRWSAEGERTRRRTAGRRADPRPHRRAPRALGSNLARTRAGCAHRRLLARCRQGGTAGTGGLASRSSADCSLRCDH